MNRGLVRLINEAGSQMTVDKTSTLLGTYMFIVLVLANYCSVHVMLWGKTLGFANGLLDLHS